MGDLLGNGLVYGVALDEGFQRVKVAGVLLDPVQRHYLIVCRVFFF